MGEGDDFEALYSAHYDALLRYALRRVADPADAADVVAETWTVAWRRRTQLPGGDADRLWLFGVARRVLANQRRGQLRRSQLTDRLRICSDATYCSPRCGRGRTGRDKRARSGREGHGEVGAPVGRSGGGSGGAVPVGVGSGGDDGVEPVSGERKLT